MTSKKNPRPFAEKAPAFQFYARDWLASASVSLMSHAAQASYLRLLCHQWLAGILPGDAEGLRRLTQCTPAEWRRVWPELEPHFPATDGGRVNARIAAQREEDEAFRDRQSEAGRLGNEIRWGSRGESQDGPEPPPRGSQPESPGDRSAIAPRRSRRSPERRSSSSSAVEPPSSPDGEEAPPSSPPAAPEPVGLEARLPERARATYRALRDAHPKPWAFDALLESAAEPTTGGQHFSWAHLGEALVQVAGQTPPVPISQKTLRGWMRENVAQAAVPDAGVSPRDRLVALLREVPLPAKTDARWGAALEVPQVDAVRYLATAFAKFGTADLQLPGVAHMVADNALAARFHAQDGAA